VKEINPGIDMQELGWDGFFSGAFESMRVPDSLPGRVVSLEKDSCHVLTESGELFAGISGKMRFHTNRAEQYPAVGDWVVIQPLDGDSRGIIHAILPRKSKFSRHITGGRPRLSGGKTEEQVVAANMDIVFLVGALDGGRGINLRRMERYIAIAKSSGAAPVIVLNKADLCPDVEARVAEVETVAYGIPVCAVSAKTRAGLDTLENYLTPGITGALLGQSGVGKSAIINALLGEERQATSEVRENDRRGRHTTTRRQLILLPRGGAIIDTPGIREIQVWGDEKNLDEAFEDISKMAKDCRFSDCRHDTEPGCAIRAAIRRGELEASHFKNYQKLQRELIHLAARQAGKAALEEKMRWKQISQFQKRRQKKDKDVI
jgi:ribosome biogenesis GTPase